MQEKKSPVLKIKRYVMLVIAVCIILALSVFMVSSFFHECSCRNIANADLISGDQKIIEESDHVVLPGDIASYYQEKYNYKDALYVQLVPAGTTYKDYTEGEDFRHPLFLDEFENFVDCRCSS